MGWELHDRSDGGEMPGSSSATVVGTTTLTSNRNRYGGGEFWIQGKRVLGPDNEGRTLTFWDYPADGRDVKTITVVGFAWGIAVSPHSK
jgi:hypothetical protein